MKYGQSIQLDDGELTVDGCDSREEATRKAVELAIDSGWKPKRSFAFLGWATAQHLIDEYDRQTGAPS